MWSGASANPQAPSAATVAVLAAVGLLSSPSLLDSGDGGFACEQVAGIAA